MHYFMISFVLGLGGGGLDLRAAQWHLVFRRGFGHKVFVAGFARIPEVISLSRLKRFGVMASCCFMCAGCRNGLTQDVYFYGPARYVPTARLAGLAGVGPLLMASLAMFTQPNARELYRNGFTSVAWSAISIDFR